MPNADCGSSILTSYINIIWETNGKAEIISCECMVNRSCACDG